MRKRDRVRRARRAGTKAAGNMRKLQFLERCSKGGKTTAARMTPEQLSERGRKAIAARHRKKHLEEALEQTGEPPLDDDLVL